jgi:hypothetical protein
MPGHRKLLFLQSSEKSE